MATLAALDLHVDAGDSVDLLVAHDVGLPQIERTDDNAITFELLAACYEFFFCNRCHFRGFSLVLSLRLYRSLVVYLYLGFVLDGPNHLIGSGNDLVAFLETGEHLDIGGSGDTCLDLLEDCLLTLDHEHALDFFLLPFLTGSGIAVARHHRRAGLASKSPFCRTVSAWIGIVRTFGRVAVVIFAVQESPGRISSGGLSRAITTLKSLASWLEMALCEAATPEERRIAVLPISLRVP